ncbi:FAD-dependent oxidoreductase [Glycomyces arizonensis]|uniref:FAD-dependent oxidoreductase n=1 Tax=Glycomyces arizonensis TaxID=256035 RepID=UPI0005518CB3|nr:FAD-dependent oxidoreductase [Glycomyces arizonensis]
MIDTDFEVVVCGAGPVGLLLACELRLRGVTVAVVERLTEPDTTIKAGAINTPTAEALYRRGLLPELAAAQERNLERFRSFLASRGVDAPRKAPPKFAGHFAGLMMSAEHFDQDDPAFAGHGPAGDVGMVNQQDMESILDEWARRLGVTVRRGTALTGLTDHGDAVTAETSAGPLRARWLVGCDGGRSTVRRLAAFDFPGTDPEITGHQAIVEMEGAERLGGGWNTTPTGIYANGPFPGRILTVELDGPPADRDAPITAAELEAGLRHVSGVDVTITDVHSATRFTDNARQATTYRKGRILLAGDAAHVHSPFGGQGLNLGIGDAFNLGWKLAATLQGWAPAGLLDTYTAERHPIGAWVLDWSRAQVALMRTDERSRALRGIVHDLLSTTAGTTYAVKQISGVWHRYDLPGDHDLVGRSAPDLALADGSALADHLHDGRALLLDLAGRADLREAADAYRDRAAVVSAKSPDTDVDGLLVRPDGVVAWAGADMQGLTAALAAWLGAPSR